LRQEVETWAPWVWWFEVRNTLIAAERRRRIAAPDVSRFLNSVNRLPILVDEAPGETDVMQLARRHRLSVYDAAYLELAQHKGASLATLDGALAAAATEAGLSLV
jgi:predicted nucleic acid-binding protein